MTFVEQEVNQSMVSCCLKEYDHLNTSFEAPSLALNTYLVNERGKFQDSLALDDSQCKSKCTISNGSLTRSENSSPIPRWMTPKLERQFNIRSSIKNGLVANMAIVEPQNSMDFLHSHSQESMKPLLFPIIGTEAERPNDFGVGLQSTADLFNSEHALQKRAPSIPSGVKTLEAPSRKEHEDSRLDVLSFFIEKQQKHPFEGRLEVLPSLVPSLARSHPSENNSLKNSDVSSWVSKFPFQIGPNKIAGESVDLVRSAFQRQFLEPSNVLNSIRNCASQLADTKNYVDQSNFLIQHPPSLVGLQPGHIQANGDSITSKCASTGPDMAFLKRDRNTKLGESVKVPQTLPGFFAQQIGMKTAKANFFGDPETCLDVKGNGVTSKDLSSRFGGETAERNRKPAINLQKMEQQELACGSPLAQETLSHEFSLEMTVPSVKFQASAVSHCAQSALMDALWENVKTDVFEGKYGRPARQAARQLSCIEFDVNKLPNNGPATESMPLAKCTPSQMGGNSFHTLAAVPLYSLAEKTSVFKGVAKTKAIPESEWNEFLATSTTREVTSSPIKIMLPFEQRFNQLQGFLKKCDHSDMEYFQRAFHMLSANVEGNHAVELKSRALRLSLEEGKEIKRAKLLNMLDESRERPYLASSTSSMGPYFLSIPIVKESA